MQRGSAATGWWTRLECATAGTPRDRSPSRCWRSSRAPYPHPPSLATWELTPAAYTPHHLLLCARNSPTALGLISCTGHASQPDQNPCLPCASRQPSLRAAACESAALHPPLRSASLSAVADLYSAVGSMRRETKPCAAAHHQQIPASPVWLHESDCAGRLQGGDGCQCGQAASAAAGGIGQRLSVLLD